MAKLTNYTRGPKGVNTAEGVVFINPGQTVDVELSSEELASSKKTGWFSKAAAEDAEAEANTPAPAPKSETKA
jgi:hypothetical protein